MVHVAVDLTQWRSVFPLAQLREQARTLVLERQREDPSQYPDQAAVDRHLALIEPRADSISGPKDIAVLEQLREEALAAKPAASEHGVPTDVFVWAKGEPPRRDITKVGGLPYWPKSKRWPRSLLGRPKTFVGQISFVDSKDIVPRLPGDILLVFAHMEHAHDSDPRGLLLEWMSLGQADLVEHDDIPETGTAIEPFYAGILRTRDYPREAFAAPQHQQAAVSQGTKIGGIPRFAQDEPRFTGQFLCSLGSIEASFGHEPEPHPWLNVSEPITPFSEAHSEDRLMWGDVGTLYIFVDQRGRASGEIQSY